MPVEDLFHNRRIPGIYVRELDFLHASLLCREKSALDIRPRGVCYFFAPRILTLSVLRSV